MPNWCSNKLEVIGDPDKLAVFFEALGEDKIFSFEKFLPSPEPLKKVMVGGKKGAPVWVETPDGSKELSKKEVNELLEKYGALNWYDWNVANWGTKWDVGDNISMCGMPGLGVLYCNFDTAWVPPVKFIENVSKKFPELIFALYYSEGGAEFWGSTTVTNGNVDKFSGDGFWKEEFDDEADDLRDNCVPDLAKFLCEHGLHTGG